MTERRAATSDSWQSPLQSLSAENGEPLEYTSPMAPPRDSSTGAIAKQRFPVPTHTTLPTCPHSIPDSVCHTPPFGRRYNHPLPVVESSTFTARPRVPLDSSPRPTTGTLPSSARTTQCVTGHRSGHLTS